MKLYLCFALLLNLYSIDSKDFCESFRKNGNKISYTYRRGFTKPTHPRTNHDIIIDGRYWRIQFKDDKSGQEFDFLGNHNESKECPFFSNDYVMATSLRFNEKDWMESYAVLFHTKNWTQISVGRIPGDDYTTERDLTDYREVMKMSIEGMNGETPKLVFSEAPNYENIELYNRIVVIRQPSNGLLLQRYLLSLTSNKLNAKQIDSNDLNALKEMKAIHRLVAVMPQWGHQEDKYGFILLFQDEQIIRWCWSSANQLNTQFCISEPRLFANCTSTEEPGETDPPEPEESKTLVWILVIIVLIIVIILFIVLILYLCCGRKKKTQSDSSKGVSTYADRSTFSAVFGQK